MVVLATKIGTSACEKHAKALLLSTKMGTPACEKHAKALQLIEDLTTNAGKVQEKVLSEILNQNAEVEYLNQYDLGGTTDRETFKSKIPVVVYEDLMPYIKRIANGDHCAILTGRPISELFTSSGTAGGEPKLIPAIEDDHDRRRLLYSLLMPIMNLYVPDLDKGKVLFFLFVRAETTTPGGFVARPMLTSYYKSDQFKNRPYDPYLVYTSPNEAILCPDSFQSLYTQMLCGLLEREQVNRLGAIFASILLRAIRFLQLHWRALANDIETGTLNQKIKDPSIRRFMTKILEPRPELAEFIRIECSKENWERIITRIWPNTKYLDVIVTGAMAQYIPMLDYYSGGLPLVCTRYASSECPFGINLNPMCKPSEVSYTLMPNMAYFEFIPQEPGSSEKLVDLVDVELGKDYELVATTYGGFYRYRVGDILRVTGFHNSAPQFRFVRRKNTILSIDADKTDEVELQNAIENSSRLLREFNTSVVDFTSFAETSSNPGHYVIYWELLVRDSAKYPTNEVLNQCCLAIEENLNTVYRLERVVENLIGPLEIRIVKNGTFEELMDYAVSRGASINQYKVPRCVNAPLIKLLDSRVTSVHFSPALPHWSPDRKW